ncbi:alginate lyase family protein [Larkinella sp. C7]|uniref:heparinase II/III family protein n=1 Tax=Larkinella sp. C7 TaxID=2576607 RepID=UPI001485F672|nr:alginate lyase family protein [Larkinella sp. C7]
MLNRYHWFYYRLRSLSTAEVGFRLRQYFQKQADRQQVGWKANVFLATWPERIFGLSSGNVPAFPFLHEQKIFEQTLDYRYPIDWHLDLSTNKRFPLTYTKEINIQNAAFGNVEYVWEVNRFLFLPALALRYQLTADPRELSRLITLISSWVKANPYLLGVNWYSNQEVNIRLINWFICWNILDASVLAKTDPVFQRFVESVWLPIIYQHCLYSRNNLPFPSTAGHQLIAGYAGLFVASSLWKFPESLAWHSFAQGGLEQEMQRQQGANGINPKGTAGSISFITDLFLLPYLTGLRTGNPFSARYAHQLENLFSYMAQLPDEQGHVPAYGDEGSGYLWYLDNPTPTGNFRSLLSASAILFGDPLSKERSHGFDLKNRLLFGDEGLPKFKAVPPRKTSLGSQFYPAEGHYILRKQEAGTGEIYVHFNAASLDSSALPPHGHADALSFVIHVDGQPFFVDSGTYVQYSTSDWRRYFVSTRAHNTVCIDCENQAFLDDDLRWLNPYVITTHKAEISDFSDEVIASHNGYDRLGCSHQRRMEFDKRNNRLLIDDQVESRRAGTRTVEVLFHVHPAIRFRAKGRNHFILSHPQTKRLVVLHIDPVLQVEVVNGQQQPDLLGWYSAGLYQKQATCVFRAYLTLGAERRVELQHQITVQS